MRVVGAVGKIGHKFMDIKTIKNHICESKKAVTKVKSKTSVSGTVGIALLVGAVGVVAIVSPFVKAQLQRGEVENIEMVSIQQNTADFLKLNTMAVNYANSALGDIYVFVQTGFTEEQREVLLAKKYGLMEYKNQLAPSNPLFLDLSENTVQKVTILLSAIDNFLDHSTNSEEDMVKLNAYTTEYKKASEREQELLVALLDYAGMNYEVLPNGQIKYSYLKLNE